MQNTAWSKAVAASADPKRAGHFHELLKEGAAAHLLKEASPEQAAAWCALFSGSEASGDLLLAHPEWLEQLRLEFLDVPRRAEGLRRDLHSHMGAAQEGKDYAGGLRKIREFKGREMLRIAARDLARLGTLAQILQEISDVADVCLEAVFDVCFRKLGERGGLPYHQEPDGKWRRTQFAVLGMGKLGGQELNYSSDIDLLFVYTEEGSVFKTAPRKNELSGRGLSNHQFFKQLAESFIAELTRMAPEGTLFRVDMRLRPEGKAGPIARSLESYENYYAQYGQTWERMMLIKARPVAGDSSLGAEFIEMIQPFRYSRMNQDRTPKEVAQIKARTEQEIVKSGEIDRNVKLGRGGIREIEFVAQTLQVLHAGRLPFLQNSQTLPTLQKMEQYHLLKPLEVSALTEAYGFLREVEHRLQLDQHRQTHTIPTERKARERLAALMGFGRLAQFEAALAAHTKGVRAIYDSVVQIEVAPGKFPRDFEASEAEWKSELADHSFIDPEASFKRVREFVMGPGYGHISARTSESAFQLLERFMAMCRRKGEQRSPETFLSDPDRVLARLDSFVAAYGARALLYETWAGTPSLFDLLLRLFDRSESLAELAIRVPDLIDELEQSGQLRRRKTAATVLSDLRHGLGDADQFAWIRKYHQAERMRIASRDILGLADAEQTQIELTGLADACLQYALEVVCKGKAPPFAIIGLGKLGGQELIYGSDLDIIFVAPNGIKNLPTLQKRALEVMALLTERTVDGVAFETDARLRPDGEKGLHVNTLAAYEEYYRKRAMLWEIQSLSRARFIAGDEETAEGFTKMVDRVCNFSRPSEIAAYQENWLEEIQRMRLRIENERTGAGEQRLAIKTGAGGLMDAEFAAQALCLKNGWRHPNTLRALARAAAEKKAPAEAIEAMTRSYRNLIGIERILRRWSFEAESVLPKDPAPLYRVAVRCGFNAAEEFLASVDAARAEMRQGYDAIFARP